MSDLRKAAEDILEALDKPFTASKTIFQAQEALRQALAQPDEVLAEREECAKLCDEMPLRSFPSRASDCAAAIRARGER